jgi:hypothetical protein
VTLEKLRVEPVEVVDADEVGVGSDGEVRFRGGGVGGGGGGRSGEEAGVDDLVVVTDDLSGNGEGGKGAGDDVLVDVDGGKSGDSRVVTVKKTVSGARKNEKEENAHNIDNLVHLSVRTRLVRRRLDLLARSQVPQPDNALVATGVDRRPRRFALLPLSLLVRNVSNRNLDDPDRLERLEDRHRLPQHTALKVPNIDNLVPRSTDEQLPILRNVETSYDADVPIENVQAIAGSQVPHSDLAVVRSRNERRSSLLSSVATARDVENHRTDDSSVTLKDVGAVPSSSVPHLDNSIRTSRREEGTGRIGAASDDGGFMGAGNLLVDGEGGERVDVDGKGAVGGEEVTAVLRRKRGGSDGKGGNGGGVLQRRKDTFVSTRREKE